MENLYTLSKDDLVDLLSNQTASYSKMQSEGALAEEFQKCILLIKAIQAEITSRNSGVIPLPNFQSTEL